MAKKKLSPKQKAFADFYIELGNAEQAAIKAGYSEKYARGNAHKLVANSCIQKYIEERMAEKDKERVASQDEVLEFLTKVLRGEVTEQVPIAMKDYWEIAEKEPSIKDRIKAAEQLGKRYGMWTEKLDVHGAIGVQIIDDIGSDGDAD
jgi:phage terminase small subunit